MMVETHHEFRLISIVVISFCLSLFMVTRFAWSTDLTKQDESILGKAKTSTSLNFTSLVNIQVINDKVVVQTKVGESKRISAINVDSHSELWAVETPIMFYNVSEGDEAAIVVVDVIDEGVLNMTAISLEHGVLFSKKHFLGGELFPSPNGVYFYTKSSPLFSNSLVVFDRAGEEILKMPRGNWDAASFDDSILAYIVGDEIQFLSIPSGNVISSISIPGSSPSNRSPTTPRFKIPRNGGQMFVSWHGKKTLITGELSIGWQQKYKPSFLNAAFSSDEEYLAVYEGLGTKCSLSLLKTEDGDVVWTKDVTSIQSEGTSRQRDVVFSGDFIRVMVPQSRYIAIGKINNRTRSELFRFDPKSGALVERDRSQGPVFLYTANGRTMSVSVIHETPDEVYFKEWTRDENTD